MEVSKIEGDAKAAAGWFDKHFPHRHPSVPPAPSGSSQQEEQAMTAPQQSFTDTLHALTGEIAANKLVSRLVQYGIGKRLTDAQADHFVTVINDQEVANAQVEQLNAQITAQQRTAGDPPLHGDGTPFPADGQHQ